MPNQQLKRHYLIVALGIVVSLNGWAGATSIAAAATTLRALAIASATTSARARMNDGDLGDLL